MAQWQGHKGESGDPKVGRQKILSRVDLAQLSDFLSQRAGRDGLTKGFHKFLIIIEIIIVAKRGPRISPHFSRCRR